MFRVLMAAAALAVASGLLTAQQANSAASTLDINGSSGSGSAPFDATIEVPGAVVGTVSGNANMPFVLLVANGISVGSMVFDAGLQLDIGPSPEILVDGVSGPFDPIFANTGNSGTRVIQVLAPGGITPLDTVHDAFQVVIVDFTQPAPFISITAATSVTYTADVGTDSVPVADAGVNQIVNSNVCVSLDASASIDPEGNGLTYSWSQVSGASVTLSDDTAVNPTFIAPGTAEVLVFQLTVNDGSLTSAVSETMITTEVVAATVSFVTDVYPIFTSAGCSGCHTGAGAGGGMLLDGTASATLAQIQMEVSGGSGLTGTRADPCDPENSPILLKPLAVAEGGAAHGGGDLFANAMSADYITILTWLQEGAQDN